MRSILIACLILVGCWPPQDNETVTTTFNTVEGVSVDPDPDAGTDPDSGTDVDAGVDLDAGAEDAGDIGGVEKQEQGPNQTDGGWSYPLQ